MALLVVALLSPGLAYVQQTEHGIVIPEVVLLPGGNALIGDFSGSGDPDERPVHKREIKPLAFGRTEVTRRQYAPFAAEHGYPVPAVSGDNATLPVTDIEYERAQEYAQWLTAKTGDTWRLPTGHEWEYAARAGSYTLFQHGNDQQALCAVANIADADALAENPGWHTTDCSDSFAGLAPTASYAPNAFGLYDVHGNVWEWVDSCGKPYPLGRSGRLPLFGASCRGKKELRGGSYRRPAWSCRSSNREILDSKTKYPDVGFRLVKE